MQKNNLLRYWRDLELFRLFDFDDLLLRKSSAIPISAIENSCKLPWNYPEDYSLNPEFEYAFDFFAAPFVVRPCLIELSRVLPDVDRELPDYLNFAGSPTHSCAARLAIDNNGNFLFDEMSLSTFPWATHQILSEKPLAINFFDSYALSLQSMLRRVGESKDLDEKRFPLWSELNEINSIFSDISPKKCFALGILGIIIPIKLKKKKDLLEAVTSETNSDSVSTNIEIQVGASAQRSGVSLTLRKKRKVDILNSFFLRDLERIESSKIESKSALESYIGSASLEKIEAEESRLDIRKLEAEELSSAINLPITTTRALWPDDDFRIPAISQKLAIDLLFSDVLSTNLIAVNGPPGTGKTSLVKDILARLIVERAQVLSRLSRPQDAFSNEILSLELTSGFRLRVRKLIPALGKLGLIIASSNNNAVENITRELPNKNSLGQNYSYLRFLEPVSRRYERLLSRISDEHEMDYDFWGLPSIALGRMSNRKSFSESAFFTPNKEASIVREARGERLELSLEEWRNKAELGKNSFSKAKKDFLLASKKENTSSVRELFASACLLVEAWLREVPKLDREIRALRTLLNSPDSISTKEAEALWDIFFMIVPSISTTLASVERMLPSLGSNGFGFAVIEEAGQALPQSALGIIWRSKKVLLIGDQRQIEPISATPPTLALMLKAGLALPKLESAQSIADRQMPIGTNLVSANMESLWVGLPLIEHRRCDEPMFTIANELAYDNLMISRTSTRPAISSLGQSAWYDIKGKVSSAQWVPEHGQFCQKLLERLLAQDSSPDVFFITPFRSVRTELDKVLRETVKNSASSSLRLSQRIGTIHTFQGKEADIVFLVLGCDVSTSGAADWAGEKPNLINVAITRAKRFLYVIGDIDVWHRRGYFSDLLRALPVISSSN